MSLRATVPARTATAIALATALAAAAAGPAAAHVTAAPKTVAADSYAAVTFTVPNETPDADTTELRIELPDTPGTSVSVQPHPGWSHEVIGGDEPTAIVWSADDTATAIGPGEFDTFTISVGPVPADAGDLVFPALQTYSDGGQVHWDQATEPGAAHPDRPAPTVTVTAAGDGADSSGMSTGTATAIGLSAAALALALGGAVMAEAALRRR